MLRMKMSGMSLMLLGGLAATGLSGGVTEITSTSQFTDLINDTSTVYVVKFYASWCGACKNAEKHFVTLADKYSKNQNVEFLAVNVDKSGLAQLYQIKSMPTFIVISQSKPLGSPIVGWDPKGTTAQNIQNLLVQAGIPKPSQSAE